MTSIEAKKDPVISEKLGRRAIFRHSGLQKISPLSQKGISLIIHQFFENLHTAPLVSRGTVLMQLLYSTDESIMRDPSLSFL